MPIQIPEIKRMDVPAPESAGRITASVPNVAASMEIQNKAVERLGETAIDAYEKYDDRAAEIEATKRANAYDIWYNKKLKGDSEAKTPGLIHQQGDPTPAYTSFDEEAKQKYDELTNTSNLSAKAQWKINEAMARKHNQLYDTRLTEYGSQNSRYESKIKDAAIELERDATTDSIKKIKVGDLSSLIPFDTNIKNIRSHILGEAINMGGAHIAPDGTEPYIDSRGNEVKVKINSVIERDLKKNTSEVVYNSMKNLIESDQLDQAKMLRGVYGKDLDPVHEGKIAELLDKADIKQESFKLLASLENKTYDEQKKFLNSESKTPRDAEIKAEALQKIVQNKNQKDSLKESASKDFYNITVNAVADQMRGETPFPSATAMEDGEVIVGGKMVDIIDPITKRPKINPATNRPMQKNQGGKTVRFADLIEKVTDAKQREAIYALVDKPKKSDPETLNRMVDADRLQRFTNMPPEEFYMLAQGLNEKDMNRYQGYYHQAFQQTDAQRASALARIVQATNDYYSAAGLIEYGVGGREIPETIKTRVDYVNKIREEAQALADKGVDPTSIDLYIKTKVANHKIEIENEKLKHFPGNIKFWKKPQEELPLPSTKTRYEVLQEQIKKQNSSDVMSEQSGAGIKITPENIENYLNLYEQENPGKKLPNPDELQKWLDAKEKK